MMATTGTATLSSARIFSSPSTPSERKA
jgi:hypothetical protein